MSFLPRKRPNGTFIARGAVAPSGDIASGESGTTLSRDQIKAFQVKLIDLGFTNEGRVVADGVFGDNTRAAVRAFQTARGITASGTLNAETRAALDASPGLALLVPRTGLGPQSALGPGQIAFYQQVLTALGANAASRLRIDGALGPITANAVTEFQRWWSPENMRRANASPNPDDQARWRAALARTEHGRLAVDGNLGPDTQRLLIWLAFPRERGGGGEAVEHATFAPANSVRPYLLELRAGNSWALRDPNAVPGSAFTNPEIVPTYTATRDMTVSSMTETTRRIPGRRTVSITGLNPQVGARIFADGVDVTSLAEENGTPARWVGNVWRMGIPDGTRTLRVIANDRAESQVSVPTPPPPVASFGDETSPSVANNITQRTVLVTVPLTGSPTVQGGTPGATVTQEQGGTPGASDPNTPPAVTRVPGRRTVLIYGLNPQASNNVFADEVSVTLTPDEGGRPAGWDGAVWRMGVPDTTRTLRVSSAGRQDHTVSLPAAPVPTADVANSIVERSVRVDVPAAPTAGPTQAGMGGTTLLIGGVAVAVGLYFATQRGQKR